MGKAVKKNPLKLVKALALAQMLVMGVSLPMGAEGMRLEFKLEVGTQMVPFDILCHWDSIPGRRGSTALPSDTQLLPSDLRQPLNYFGMEGIKPTYLNIERN